MRWTGFHGPHTVAERTPDGLKNSMPNMANMEPDKIITEARARITWGDSATSIRDYLVLNGIPKADADIKIKALTEARNAEIRKIGIKNTIVGMLILTVSGILLYLDIKHYQGPNAILTRKSG